MNSDKSIAVPVTSYTQQLRCGTTGKHTVKPRVFCIVLQRRWVKATLNVLKSNTGIHGKRAESP